MRFVAAAFCILMPSIASAGETIKEVTWRKPKIYITHREACLSLGFKYGGLMSAELLRDAGDRITVRCTFVK